MKTLKYGVVQLTLPDAFSDSTQLVALAEGLPGAGQSRPSVVAAQEPARGRTADALASAHTGELRTLHAFSETVPPVPKTFGKVPGVFRSFTFDMAGTPISQFIFYTVSNGTAVTVTVSGSRSAQAAVEKFAESVLGQLTVTA
jgi:hypothetical protein